MPALPDSILFATTDLGESAVLFILTVMGSLYMVVRGYQRAAGALLLSFVLTSIVISLLKIAFISCASRDSAVLSPSGHVALSTAVFGMYALLIGAQAQEFSRFLPLLVLAPLTLAIAITRVTLGFHTIGDVCVGFCVGVSVVFIIYRMLLKNKPVARFNVGALILLILAAALIFHNVKLPSEAFIRALALHLKKQSLLCS